MIEYVSAIIPTELPDGRVRLQRVDGMIIGPHSIARPEALISEEEYMSEFPDRNLDTLHQRTASGQKQFVPLIESNDNEGETWRFWLQVLGNEDDLRKLKDLLDAGDEDDEDFPYTLGDLDQETTPESEVDVLVKHTDSGYMAYEQKVTGRFICPDDLNAENFDALYKGRIKDLFR